VRLSLSHAKTFVIAGCITLACCSQAGSYLNTLAWSRYVTTSQAKLLVDGAGNTYVIYQTPDIDTGTDVNYIRYDSAGNVTGSHFLFYRASTQLTIKNVYISPPTAQKTCLYVSATEFSPIYGTAAVVTKSDLAGNQIWQSNYNDVAVAFTPVGGFVDSFDDFRLALQEISSGSKGTLEMIEMDPNGMTLLDTSNPDINPYNASFVKGQWVVTGGDMMATIPGASVRWGVYDQTGHLVTGAVIDSVDNGTYLYVYGPILSYVDPAGALDICVTVAVYRDSDQTHYATKHFVRRYNLTGSLQWISASYDDPAEYLTSFGSNNNLYVEQAPPNGFQNIEQFNHLGTRNWNSPPVSEFASYPPVCDSSGVFLFSLDGNNLKSVHFARLDSSGNNVWSTTLATSAGTSTQRASFSDAAVANDNLYSATLLPIVGGSQAVIQRYVPGVALSLLSTTATSFGDGSVIPVKVLLNSPAPAGGMAIKLTSSSAKVLFTNNSTAYTLAIPAGSLYATVNMHSPGVGGNTSVTVLGNQNGVQRAVSFTVTP
jgi:hypothetical protein